jgi:hypothetical protein
VKNRRPSKSPQRLPKEADPFVLTEWIPWGEMFDCARAIASGGAYDEIRKHYYAAKAKERLRVVDRYTGPDGTVEIRPMPADTAFTYSMGRAQPRSETRDRERQERGGGSHVVLVRRADVERFWPSSAYKSAAGLRETGNMPAPVPPFARIIAPVADRKPQSEPARSSGFPPPDAQRKPTKKSRWQKDRVLAKLQKLPSQDIQLSNRDLRRKLESGELKDEVKTLGLTIPSRQVMNEVIKIWRKGSS